MINHSALNKYFNTAFGSLALGRCGSFRSILNRAWESQDEAEKAGAALRLALGTNDGALGVRALMLEKRREQTGLMDDEANGILNLKRCLSALMRPRRCVQVVEISMNVRSVCAASL